MKATGNAFLGGTDASSVQTFASRRRTRTRPTRPSLEYPLDGVVLPGNLPPIDFQWTQASDNNLYRVHVTTPNTLDVYLYTTSLDALVRRRDVDA